MLIETLNFQTHLLGLCAYSLNLDLANYLINDRKLTPEKIILKPVGLVRTQAVGDEVRDKSHLSEIHLNSDLLRALEGIEGFSHVFVLFWLHETTSKDREMLKVHPRGRADMPLIGVFAARSKHRPNPIGLTLCRLVKVEGAVLTVRGLDAYDGTPVLDLKPYDSWDCASDATMPDWWMKLEKEKARQRQHNHSLSDACLE